MTKLLAAAACASVLLGWNAWPSAQSVSGEAVYRQRCAGCHDLVSPRIPQRAALQKMPASRILRALDFGVMMNIAYPLRRDEREAVAMLLGNGASDPAPLPSAFCADRRVAFDVRSKTAWNGWSPADANTRFQSLEAAGLTVDQVKRLAVKWVSALAGALSAFA